MFSVWKADESQYAQGASVFRVYFYQKNKSMPEMLTNNPLETGRDTSEPVSETGAAQETNTAQNNDSAEPEHAKNITRKLGRIINLGLMMGALLSCSKQETDPNPGKHIKEPAGKSGEKYDYREKLWDTLRYRVAPENAKLVRKNHFRELR